MLFLRSLPEDHPLRNSPLAEIGAEYRYSGTKPWRKVLPSFGIAPFSYNQLGDAWLLDKDWRCDSQMLLPFTAMTASSKE